MVTDDPEKSELQPELQLVQNDSIKLIDCIWRNALEGRKSDILACCLDIHLLQPKNLSSFKYSQDTGERPSVSNIDPTLDIPIALRKGLDHVLNILSLFLVSYNLLSPYIMPLYLLCPLLNYHRIGNQLLLNLNGKKPWLRRWELWERMALGSSFLLHLGRNFLDLNEFVLLNRKLMWWTIERYKARLVAKGFTRTYGIDY